MKIGDAVLAAMATITIAGCGGSISGGSSGPVSDAKTYVRTISTDAAQVQTDEIKVGLDILHNDLTGLAQDAQTAHDDFVNAKIDIVAAGSNVADNSRLGNAELQMDDAINELKNGMGAVVAFAENPNAGTLGAANSKLDQGITDWDQAATVLWTMAGQASEIPTLGGSTQASTNTNAATTSGPSASSPPNPTVSQTAINTAQQALSLLWCGGATTPLGVAFAVGNSQMVTANHITAACTGSGPDIGSTPINVMANDMTHDLALLAPNPGGSQSLTLESAAPFAREHVALLADSPGSTPTAYMGQIIATNQPVSLSAATSNSSGESLPDAIEVDTRNNVWGGATGGPAIDAAGNVVGVIVGEGSGVVWLTPASDVKALLAWIHRATPVVPSGPDV